MGFAVNGLYCYAAWLGASQCLNENGISVDLYLHPPYAQPPALSINLFGLYERNGDLDDAMFLAISCCIGSNTFIARMHVSVNENH